MRLAGDLCGPCEMLVEVYLQRSSLSAVSSVIEVVYSFADLFLPFWVCILSSVVQPVVDKVPATSEILYTDRLNPTADSPVYIYRVWPDLVRSQLHLC